MFYAKKLNSQATHTETDCETVADIFIEEVRRESGCSEAFLNEARASIVKLYRDVEGDALHKCLDDVRKLICQQAETEKICRQAKKDAHKLEEAHVRLGTELNAVRAQIVEMRNTLQVTAFSLISAGRVQGRA